MAKRFHYFDLNGLGEGIRYLFHYGEVEFEDVRYSSKEWLTKKDTLPFGQLPLYEEGNKGTINQSLAIARYIGQTLNLVAGDPWQDAQLDAIVLTFYDFWSKVLELFTAKDDVERAAVKKVLLTETLDYYFSRFETQLKQNKGFFGGKLTWVDFVFVGLVETANLYLDTNVEAKYPTIKALVEKITSYPSIKKYIATRKPYVNPLVWTNKIKN